MHGKSFSDDENAFCMNQNYFVVEVKASPEAVEAVEFALLEAGAEGTELDLLGKRQTDEAVTLRGYFNELPEDDLIRHWLDEGLRIHSLESSVIESVSFCTLENRDWLEEWKKHWKPTETGKFIVAPTWSEVDEAGDKIVLRVEPGMAFGTGTHETTRLCLQAIEEHYKGGSFFDVGTGTGVLAMAAAKLNFKFQISNFKLPEILACDTDADSIKIAIENAELNDVEDKIEFYAGSIEENTLPFDFVAANLTADVIVPLLPLLVEKARETLLLSGILREQQDWVTGELRKFQISDFKVQNQGEWISILCQNHLR